MADCKAAAEVLSLSYETNFTISSTELPGGCYLYKSYILYFNDMTNVTGAWYQGFLRNSLCEVVDAPSTTTPEVITTHDCELGVPRALVPHRTTGTCAGTHHGSFCQFECDSGYQNMGDYTVRCNNGSFVLTNPVNGSCGSDADNDGFSFDMDNGEVNDEKNTVAGCANAEEGSPIYSVVFGGRLNTASGCKAAVVGGERNTAHGNEALVGGGADNAAPSHFAAVGGGQFNTAHGTGSVIVGGASTTVAQSTISSAGTHNFVGGGYGHRVPADVSSVAGGWMNSIFDGRDRAAVGGGRECFAKGSYAVVNGGFRNTAVSISSSIGGGYLNAVIARYASVAGGSRNTAKGKSGVVLGHRGVAKQDYTLALAFSGQDCLVRSEKTVGMCAEHVYVNGVDLVDELAAGSLTTRRNRRLTLDQFQQRASSALLGVSQGQEEGLDDEKTALEVGMTELKRLQERLAANRLAIQSLLDFVAR